MVVPVNKPYKIIRSFKQRTKAPEDKVIHGAVDIIPLGDVRGIKNNEIVSPEMGDLYYFYMIRSQDSKGYININRISPFNFGSASYFYDIFGGVIMIISEDKKRTHIITHSWINQITNKLPIPIANKVKYIPVESDMVESFPTILHHTFSTPYEVSKGETIGYIGSAGVSEQPHIHWEIHNGIYWNKHKDRIDVEKLLKDGEINE